MRATVLSFLLATLIAALAGCVVVDHHHKPGNGGKFIPPGQMKKLH